MLMPGVGLPIEIGMSWAAAKSLRGIWRETAVPKLLEAWLQASSDEVVEGCFDRAGVLADLKFHEGYEVLLLVGVGDLTESHGSLKPWPFMDILKPRNRNRVSCHSVIAFTCRGPDAQLLRNDQMRKPRSCSSLTVHLSPYTMVTNLRKPAGAYQLVRYFVRLDVSFPQDPVGPLSDYRNPESRGSPYLRNTQAVT